MDVQCLHVENNVQSFGHQHVGCDVGYVLIVMLGIGYMLVLGMYFM